MSDEELSKRWAEIQKHKENAVSTAADSREDALLKAIARETGREGEGCPEPPAHLSARIMADINRDAPSLWIRLIQTRPILLPSAATICIVIAVFYLLNDPQIAPVFSTSSDPISVRPSGRTIRYNDARVMEASDGMLLFLEGSFGAIVLILCSAGVIISAIRRRYRLSAVLLIVAVLIFCARAFLPTL